MGGGKELELWLDELVQQLPVHVQQAVNKHKKRGTMISFAQNCGDGGVMLPRDWGVNKLNGDELKSWLLSWIKTHFLNSSNMDKSNLYRSEMVKVWIAPSVETLWCQLLAEFVQCEDEVWVVPPLSPEMNRLLTQRQAKIIKIKIPMQLDWLKRQLKQQAPAAIIAGSGSQEVIDWLECSETSQFMTSEKIHVFIDQTSYLHPITLLNSPLCYGVYSLQKLWFPDISLAWVVGTGEMMSLAEHNDNFMNDKQGIVCAQRLYYKLMDPLFSWDTHMIQMQEIYESRYKLMMELINTTAWCRFIADDNAIVKDGIYIWFPLRTGLQARHVLQAAMMQGVDFWFSNEWSREGDDHQQTQWLRLNYAAYPEVIIKKGISILQEVLEDFTARSC